MLKTDKNQLTQNWEVKKLREVKKRKELKVIQYIFT